MSFWTLAAGTLLYCGTMIGFWYEQDRDHALVYFGYVVANIGFLRIAWRASHPAIIP